MGELLASAAEGEGAPVALASQVASLLLIAQNDDALDLARLAPAAAALSEHLREGYLSTLDAAVRSLPEEARSVAPLMQLMAGRLAAVEADLFLLKSCLVRNRRFVLGEAAQYADPLMAVREATEGRAAAERQQVLTVQLGPAVLGQGWHAVEPAEGGGFWRWSGPGTRASLLLPGFGPGRFGVGFDFKVVSASQLEGMRIEVNGEAAAPEIAWAGERAGRLTLDVHVPPGERSSFLFLDIELSATLSPAEAMGSSDPRRLGIGMGAVRIERR